MSCSSPHRYACSLSILGGGAIIAINLAATATCMACPHRYFSPGVDGKKIRITAREVIKLAICFDPILTTAPRRLVIGLLAPLAAELASLMMRSAKVGSS